MSSRGVIRPARLDECELLTRLALRSKASWGYSDKFMADCTAELTISETDLASHAFFVMEAEGDIVGFCALQDRHDGSGELMDVFVEPEHLREGHGRRLVEHAKSSARARGWVRLLVEADPNARDFYCSCGGAQIGTVASGSIAGRRLPLIEIAL